MDPVIVTAMRRRDELERKLQCNHDFAEWRDLNQLIELYKKTSDQYAASSNGASSGHPSHTRKQSKPGVQRGKSKEYEEHARRVMTGKPYPIKTREIVSMIQDELGVDIGGSDPIGALSSVLSRSTSFESMGKEGWILKEHSDDYRNHLEYHEKGDSPSDVDDLI